MCKSWTLKNPLHACDPNIETLWRSRSQLSKHNLAAQSFTVCTLTTDQLGMTLNPDFRQLPVAPIFEEGTRGTPGLIANVVRCQLCAGFTVFSIQRESARAPSVFITKQTGQAKGWSHPVIQDEKPSWEAVTITLLVVQPFTVSISAYRFDLSYFVYCRQPPACLRTQLKVQGIKLGLDFHRTQRCWSSTTRSH